jgi:hypothetical protein
VRFVDLSIPIVPSPADTPDLLRTDIEFDDHAAGAAAIEAVFGVGPDLLHDGEGWALETFTRFGTHNSTHLDAPYHYNSRIGGERAQTIDELPLAWFFAPGVVLDFGDRADGEVIEPADLEAALATAGHELAPLDIVLVRTGRDAFIAEPDYMARGPGVSAAATHWLYDRLGLGSAAVDAGGGGKGAAAAWDLLGRAPGRPFVFADRAPRQPRAVAANRLHGRLLPAPPGRRERGAGAGGGNR